MWAVLRMELTACTLHPTSPCGQLRRRGLTTMILCGIATEFGVESTARDAYECGYQLIFAVDAMTGIHAESHANSVERIFPRMGRVRSTEEIVVALQT
jgi:nicotinamidase-related amidase